MKFSDVAYITEDILVGEDALSYTSIHVVQQIEVTWTDRFKTQICLLSQSFRNIWPFVNEIDPQRAPIFVAKSIGIIFDFVTHLLHLRNLVVVIRWDFVAGEVDVDRPFYRPRDFLDLLRWVQTFSEESNGSGV